MTDLLTAAKAWYDAGYCVVPSRDDGSKRPFGKWKDYQAERPTWGQVAEWLTSDRYTGIGVITGKVSGNVEMVEIEGPKAQATKAVKRITALVNKYDDPDLTALWHKVTSGCVETSGGGGLHLFIRVHDGHVPGNSKLAADEVGKVLAETRGEGGFVIVAPTTGRTGHETGATYAFLPGTSPANTPTITRDDLEVIHYLITEALHSHTGPLTPLAPTPTPTQAPSPVTAPTAALTPWDDYAAQTTWADILTPLGWQQAFTAPDGRTHWTRPGKDPKDGTSATTLKDGPLYVFTTSTPFPAGVGMSKQHVYAHLHHGGDHTAAARALSEQGFGQPIAHPSLPPWVPPDIDPATLSPGQLDDERDTWVREKFPTLDWAALWADDKPEEWIAEPLLPARRLVALYSAPKVGKSLLMLEIATAIAAGKPLFGMPTKQTRVLYVDFENDPRGDVRRRLMDMGYAPDELADLCYLSFPTMAGLDSERGSQELVAAAEVYGCHVIVIDTVSRSVEGDENENDTWLAFYRHTGLKLKQRGIAMIRLDHAGKDEAKGQRGGSAKSGDVDAVWRLRKSGDDLIDLICEAQRFPIERKELTLRREEEPLRHVIAKDPVRDKREALFEVWRRHNVPKMADLHVTNARALVRERCGSSPNFNKETWAAWCAEIAEFQPQMSAK